MNLHETFTRAQYVEAADFIRSRTAHRPRLGLILGSGLNPLADEVVGADRIPYGDIPHFPRPGVEGHKGQLVVGQLAGQEVLIMQGRAHAYEGYTLQQVTLPVRVMNELGIGTLILTNAAGGLNPTFHAGDLMLINDHIGLMAIVGGNPLWGPNDPTLGPRFPAMNKAYDPELRALTRRVAAELGVGLREGVYIGLGGPTFETPAEVRFGRMIGGDAMRHVHRARGDRGATHGDARARHQRHQQRGYQRPGCPRRTQPRRGHGGRAGHGAEADGLAARRAGGTGTLNIGALDVRPRTSDAKWSDAQMRKAWR